MKKILLIFLILCFSSTAMAWPFGKKEPKNKPNTQAIVKAVPTPAPTPKPTLQVGREILRELSNELKSAKEENSRLKKSLDKANAQLNTAELRVVEVQKQADALKEWGVIQQQQAHKFMEKYNNAVKRYHRLKLIAALIAAAAGVFVGLQFMNLVPPPYNFGVPVGGAILFSTLVWLLL